MNDIVPVLLAGGSGTRLWPLSRKSYPKQFTNIFNDKSIFQQTVLRLTSSEIIKFKPHITLTNFDFRFFVAQQLSEIGIDPGPIIIEPEMKDTAPAILTSALYAYKENPDSILLVAPTDHVIHNEVGFHHAVKEGLSCVMEGNIVTFGIFPTHAETAYGYLEIEKLNLNTAEKVIRFIEKPNKNLAKEMISKGNFLWNSGIFLFKAKDMIEAFKKYDKETLHKIELSLKKSKIDLGFIKLDPISWSKTRSISIDFAIMEKVNNISAIPFSVGWSDLGNWKTVWKEMIPSKDGVSLSSQAYSINCNNTLLRSENKNQLVVGLGLKNIITIAMQDAVLVLHKDKTEEIKNVVEMLKSKKITQAENFVKDYRPWGFFEVLAESDIFKVKKIYINSNASLSLQKHKHRSEHWVVVNGIAKVTIEDKIKLINSGESIFVPQGSVHRIENTSKNPVILIEVQIGKYLGEDDIIRYEDLYFRQ